MSTGSINVVLNVDSTGFTSGLTTAQTGLKNLNLNITSSVKGAGQASSAFSSLGVSLHGVIIKAALAGDALRNINAVTTGFMYSIAKSNGELERMGLLMTGLSKAATQAGKDAEGVRDMNFVVDMAKNAPVALEGLTDAFVKLKTTGIDPTAGALQTLVDANAHFGGTEDSLKRAAVAISQMSSKGKVSMEELRQQLAEAIPNASTLMARGMGMSMDDFIKAVSKGSVNSKQALQLMFREMEIEFSGSAKKMMDSWVGLTSQLSTQWLLFQKEIGDAKFFDVAKAALRELVDVLKTEDMAAFAASFGHTLGSVTTSIVDMTKYILANREAIGKWLEVIAEVYVAFRAWSILAGVAASVSALGASLTAYRTAVLGAATATAAFEAVLAPAAIAAGALTLPLTILSGVLVATGIAWYNWGDSATSALDDVKQAVADGVKVSVEGVRAIDEAIAAGERAKERQKNQGVIGEASSSVYQAFGGKSDEQKIQEEKVALALQSAEKERSIYQSVADFKVSLGRQTDDVKALGDANALASLQKLSDEKTAAGVKDLAKDKDYVAQSVAIQNTRNAEIIDGYRRLTEESAPALKSFTEKLNALTTIDPKKKDLLAKELAATIFKAADAFRVGAAEMDDASGRFSPDTKGKDAAAKKAAREIAAQDSAYATLKAQLERKKALLDQPHEIGAEVVSMGPEEARIQSFIDSGKVLKAGTIELAREMDKTNKLLADQGKIWESLAGTERNAAKNSSKSLVDLQHAQAVLANGGFETMSKETLRYNELMGITNDKLDEQRELMKGDTAAFDRHVIAIKAQVKATADNAVATDRANRESSSLVNVQKINASLIGITRDRANAIFAIERNAKMKEFGLTEDMLKANTAGYENQIKEIEAMEAQHARQIENPLKTMARSWNDMGENIRQASTQWMTGFSDQLTTMLINGKADFASFTKAVLADIARIMVQKMLIGLGTAAMGFLGGGGGGSTYGVTNTSFSTLADGGIMSSMGKLPLNKYASGGVAKSPQVAIFGEGRQNEAYVPLPDGKSIPVTMKGGGGAGDNNVSININVDGGGNATQDKKGGKGDADMWGKMADSIKGIVVQTISEQRRPGGQLWAG